MSPVDFKKNMYMGIFWKIVSYFLFASVNGIVRYLSGGSALASATPLPIYMIMFFQNAIGSIIILPILLKNKPIIHSMLTTQYRNLNILRIIVSALGIGLWYLSLQYIPLTEVVALSFAAPFVAIIGAVIFLQEKLNIYRIISIILSIIGGFLIARPDLGLQNSAIGWLAILPLLATLIFAVDKIITRKLLIKGGSVVGITLLLIVCLTPLCLLPTLFYGWQMPATEQWPWLLLLSVLSVSSHFAFNKAFSYAEVTVLMPFSIIKMVFCGLIAYFVFAELPHAADIWLGIMVVIISTVILNYDTRSKA